MDKQKLKKMQQKAKKASSGYLRKDRINHQIDLLEGEKARNQRVILASIPALAGLFLYLDLGISKNYVFIGLGIYTVIGIVALITSSQSINNKIKEYKNKAENEGIDLKS